MSSVVRKSEFNTGSPSGEQQTQHEAIQSLADALAVNLTTVASPSAEDIPKVDIKQSSTRKFSSSFFFSMKGEYAEKERMRRMSEVKTLPSSTEAVLKVSKEVEKALPRQMEPNIEEVRNFFLHTLGPKTLASMSGLEEACAIIERITGASVDRNTVDSFRRIMIQGSRIKMVQFVSKFLDLNAQSRKDLMDSVVRGDGLRPREGGSTIVIPGIGDPPPHHPMGEGDLHHPQRKKERPVSKDSSSGKGRRYPF